MEIVHSQHLPSSCMVFLDDGLKCASLDFVPHRHICHSMDTVLLSPPSLSSSLLNFLMPSFLSFSSITNFLLSPILPISFFSSSLSPSYLPFFLLPSFLPPPFFSSSSHLTIISCASQRRCHAASLYDTLHNSKDEALDQRVSLN